MYVYLGQKYLQYILSYIYIYLGVYTYYIIIVLYTLWEVKYCDNVPRTMRSTRFIIIIFVYNI